MRAPTGKAGAAPGSLDAVSTKVNYEELSKKLEVVGAGGGGIEEMVPWMSDAEVMWALLRFELGSGSFARTKVLFLHFNGEDCPSVRRGKDNSLTKEVNWILRGGQEKDGFHACIQLKRVEEVTASNVLAMVTEYFVIDNVEGYSTAWAMKEYYNQLAKEREAAERRVAEEKAKREAAKEAEREAKRQALAAAREPAMRERQSRKKSRKSGSSFVCGRDALKSIANKGLWNWVLLGPDTAELPLVGGGSGSVDEMRECAKERGDLVMFGLLRLGFGEGRLKRIKYAFVHLIGPEVSAVKRGKYNALRPAMEEEIKKHAPVSVTFYDTAPEDLILEVVIERVRKVAVVDEAVLEGEDLSKSIFSVEAFKQALAQEQADAARSSSDSGDGEEDGEDGGLDEDDDDEDGQEDDPRLLAPHAPNSEREITEVLQLVRTERQCNWALFRPKRADGRKTAGCEGLQTFGATSWALADRGKGDVADGCGSATPRGRRAKVNFVEGGDGGASPRSSIRKGEPATPEAQTGAWPAKRSTLHPTSAGIGPLRQGAGPDKAEPSSAPAPRAASPSNGSRAASPRGSGQADGTAMGRVQTRGAAGQAEAAMGRVPSATRNGSQADASAAGSMARVPSATKVHQEVSRGPSPSRSSRREVDLTGIAQSEVGPRLTVGGAAAGSPPAAAGAVASRGSLIPISEGGGAGAAAAVVVPGLLPPGVSSASAMVERPGRAPRQGEYVKILVENDAGKYSTSIRRGTKGLIGRVAADDGSAQPYKVDLGDGKERWYRRPWVCVVEPAPAPRPP